MIRRSLTIASLLAASGCSLGFHNRPTLHWSGKLTPTADPAHCPPTRGVLVLREGQVNFAPDDGTWILSGKAAQNTLQAANSRPTSDHKTYATELKAEWNDQSVTGTYTTPFCTYAVNLIRY